MKTKIRSALVYCRASAAAALAMSFYWLSCLWGDVVVPIGYFCCFTFFPAALFWFITCAVFVGIAGQTAGLILGTLFVVVLIFIGFIDADLVGLRIGLCFSRYSFTLVEKLLANELEKRELDNQGDAWKNTGIKYYSGVRCLK